MSRPAIIVLLLLAAVAASCARVNTVATPEDPTPARDILQFRIRTEGPIYDKTYYYIAIDEYGRIFDGPEPILSGDDTARGWTHYILLYNGNFYFGTAGWKTPAEEENYIDDWPPPFLWNFPNMVESASVVEDRQIVVRLYADAVPNQAGVIGFNFITSDTAAHSDSDAVAADFLDTFHTIRLNRGQNLSSNTFNEPAFDVLLPRRDTDGDGVPDDIKHYLGFPIDNALSTPPDSDGDGYPDAVELAYGSDPNDPNDYPPLPLDRLWDSRDLVYWLVNVE